jgi:hypothetical protein
LRRRRVVITLGRRAGWNLARFTRISDNGR